MGGHSDIFVSATSLESGSAFELAVSALQDLGCRTVYNRIFDDDFEAPSSDRQSLIGKCDAFVQIVELPSEGDSLWETAFSETPRGVLALEEAKIAVEMGKPLFVFIVRKAGDASLDSLQKPSSFWYKILRSRYPDVHVAAKPFVIPVFGGLNLEDEIRANFTPKIRHRLGGREKPSAPIFKSDDHKNAIPPFWRHARSKYPRFEPPEVPVPRTNSASGKERSRPAKQEEEDVFIATANPPEVKQGQTFASQIAIYAEGFRNQVEEIVSEQSVDAKLSKAAKKCRWKKGARIAVSLTGTNVAVEPPIQKFEWNGEWEVVPFQVTDSDDIEDRIVLHCVINVEGTSLISLNPEIRVIRSAVCEPKPANLASVQAPEFVFASYTRKDRREVMGRLRSLQIFTGTRVFLDCLSIRPGKDWREKIFEAISRCDQFLLFWSKRASESSEVEKEWRKALNDRGIGVIQPHPLEPPKIAPPPKELEGLEFGAAYEMLLVQIPRGFVGRFLQRLLISISRR